LEAGYQRFASGFEGVPFETMTGTPELEPSLGTPTMVDGMEAIDHEAQASFQKKAQQDEVCSAFA